MTHPGLNLAPSSIKCLVLGDFLLSAQVRTNTSLFKPPVTWEEGFLGPILGTNLEKNLWKISLPDTLCFIFLIFSISTHI